jgi:hypothetical protein
MVHTTILNGRFQISLPRPFDSLDVRSVAFLRIPRCADEDAGSRPVRHEHRETRGTPLRAGWFHACPHRFITETGQRNSLDAALQLVPEVPQKFVIGPLKPVKVVQ